MASVGSFYSSPFFSLLKIVVVFLQRDEEKLYMTRLLELGLVETVDKKHLTSGSPSGKSYSLSSPFPHSMGSWSASGLKQAAPWLDILSLSHPVVKRWLYLSVDVQLKLLPAPKFPVLPTGKVRHWWTCEMVVRLFLFQGRKAKNLLQAGLRLTQVVYFTVKNVIEFAICQRWVCLFHPPIHPPSIAVKPLGCFRFIWCNFSN